MGLHRIPPPPTLTLLEQRNSPAVPAEQNADDSSDFEHCSHWRYQTFYDQSDSVLLQDTDSQEDDEDDKLHYSPVNTARAYSCSHWSSTPWDSRGGTRTSRLDIPDWRYTPDWSDTWPSGGDVKPSESDCSEASSREETEPKPLIPVPPAWRSEIKQAIVGAGLSNLGNTCFLNAVLQCFTHTVPLIRGLCSYDHPRPCDRDSEGFCIVCALRNHLELSLSSTGGVVFPRRLVDNLRYFSSDFRRFQQEDAHEFLQCFLDRLASCCFYPDVKETMLSSADENLVTRVFGGRLVSKLQCCNCGHCSETYEPLIDLSLEIENVCTLASALESFTKVEKIEDPESKFACETCQEGVSIKKQLILDQPPMVAAFHLKRFKNDGSYVEKIDKYVEFPLELDLLPYTRGCPTDTEDLKYDLYAVLVHIGFSSTSGHYYCFVRSAPDTWYRLDDSKVARVREDFVLSQDAYILFYAKQGTPWFKCFIETEKASLAPHITNNTPMSILDNLDHICTSSDNVADTLSCEVSKVRENVVSTCTSAESLIGCRDENVVRKEAKDDLDELFMPEPLALSNSSNVTSGNDEKKFSPSRLKENDFNQEFSQVINNDNMTSSSPPRSSSQELYAEEPAECSTSILGTYRLLSEKQVPCKRQFDKDPEDSQRTETCKLLRNMHNDRSSKILTAMNAPSSEGPQYCKSNKKMDLSSNRSNPRSSTCPKPVAYCPIRPMAARSFR